MGDILPPPAPKATSTRTVHLWGGAGLDDSPTDVKAAIYDGHVSMICPIVFAQIREHGHTITNTYRVRRFSGELVSESFTVTLADGSGRMWHKFTEPSDPWFDPEGDV